MTPEAIATYIHTHLRLLPAPAVPEIRLYQGHPGSGLSRFIGEDGPSPYWAYGWAGGTVLARHILDHPKTVTDLRVLDLGTGSGIVAIAAALAGAGAVAAADIDPAACVAARLNAAKNGVDITVRHADLLDGDPPDADLILAGDLFYDPALARRVTAFLTRCRAAGVAALVGDPGRKPLPLGHLRQRANPAVPDFGQNGPTQAAVYDFDTAL